MPVTVVRVGAVGYLNARPLTWALDRSPERWAIRYDVPSVCARLLHEGHTDLGLVPSIDLDELVRQCRAAIAWIHRHAREWGGDPDRITVSGHSAGGHLVAMLLATDWSAFGAPGDVVKAGCAISGLYDLEPIRLCYLNEVLKLTPEIARRHSPVHLAPARPTPLVLALGGAEGAEYHRQTDDLMSAWRPRGVPIEVMDLPGHDHFSIVAELQSPFSPLARAIQSQMGLA